MPTNKYYHLKQSGLLNSMLFLERFAFYGLQTFAYNYLISDALNLYGKDAAELLLTFSSALLFARIFGGIIVDFLLGAKISIIVSCALQITGILLFMQKQLGLFYLGMFVFIAGQCLFSPAILKSLGIIYSHKRMKLDGAVTLSMFAINLGSFLAVEAFPYLELTDTFESGFTSCIVCFLVIAGLSFLIRFRNDHSQTDIEKLEFGKRANELIFLSILALFLYWLFEQLLRNSVQGSYYSGFRPTGEHSLFNTIPYLIPVAGYLLAGILWNRFHFSSLLKIVIGFGVAVIAIIAALVAMENSQVDDPKYITIYLLFNFTAEILIVPVCLSLILQYAPQRLMGLYSGLALSAFGFLSLYVGNKVFEAIGEENYQLTSLIAGAGFLFCMVAALILFLLTGRKERSGQLDEF